jgi:hypothetical protein
LPGLHPFFCHRGGRDDREKSYCCDAEFIHSVLRGSSGRLRPGWQLHSTLPSARAAGGASEGTRATSGLELPCAAPTIGGRGEHGSSANHLGPDLIGNMGAGSYRRGSRRNRSEGNHIQPGCGADLVQELRSLPSSQRHRSHVAPDL